MCGTGDLRVQHCLVGKDAREIDILLGKGFDQR